MSLGLQTGLALPRLKSLRIASHDPTVSSYTYLQPKGLECPVPAKVINTVTGPKGSWPGTNRDYGALTTLTELVIPATEAVLNMTDFECKPGYVLILLLQPIAACINASGGIHQAQQELFVCAQSPECYYKLSSHFSGLKAALSLQEPLQSTGFLCFMD